MPSARFNRRSLLRLCALTGASSVALGVTAAGRASALTNDSRLRASDASPLPDTVLAVMQKPRYAKSMWYLLVTDLNTGETLYELQADQMAFTGSVRKLFSVGLALNELGANHRFTTPVYRTGRVDTQGILHGDLVLAAAGDLTMGGRLNADGGIAFTDFDHNDANNLGTAILTPQNPLSGLDALAQQVAASGVQTVTGDVIVDDRLFESFRVPNQNLLITPIMVNENMVDVTVTPTQMGFPASVDWRPKSDSFGVIATINTVASGLADTVELSGDARVNCVGVAGCAGTIYGDIPADYRAPLSNSSMLVQTFRIENPADYARTAFMESLERAGISLASTTVASNQMGSLLYSESYSPDALVAQFVSAPYSEYAKLILKVSLNLGANLSLMLFGLANGQRTVDEALSVERQTLIAQMGLGADAFEFPTNGSGSPDSRATARAVVQMLMQMAKTDVAQSYRAALPILGVDGSLAHSGVELPAKGHVYAKTGTTIDATGLKAQNLAGYIDARSGRQLAFAVFVNDAGPIESIIDVSDVFEDEAAIANVLYQVS